MCVNVSHTHFTMSNRLFTMSNRLFTMSDRLFTMSVWGAAELWVAAASNYSIA